MSAQSRNAWGADQGYDNQCVILDECDEIAPAAMVDEIYDPSFDNQAGRNSQPEPENTSGCWYRFKSGIRCRFRNCFIVFI